MTEVLTLAQYATARRKNSKYGNKPCVVDGIKFASKAEARRYGELLLLEKSGEISDLKLQPRYTFEVNGVHVGHYTADFSYATAGGNVVEDVKSKASITEAYVVRRRLMLALHGIAITEIM
jgi:hypothetical protein